MLTDDERRLRGELARVGGPADYLAAIGWKLYPWQEWIYREAGPLLLLVAARQVGKTFLAAGKARHKQVTEKGSVTPVVCPNQDKSKILVSRVKEVAARDHLHVRWDPDNAEEVGEEGSIIKGLPGTLGGVVGLTAPLLMLDEAGLIGEGLYQAATPMQAHVDEPELWVMSSAWWKRGWFYEAWDKGPSIDVDGRGFRKVLVRPPLDIFDGRVVDVAYPDRIVEQAAQRGVHAFFSSTPTAAFLEDELTRHPEWVIRQQYLCEFQDVDDAALSPVDVARMWDDGVVARRIGSDTALTDVPGRRVG